jgi:hypothetical protein
MATLLLTAAGSLLGPIGGALGALVGRQIDSAIFGSRKIEGPRLKELAVTTSSYGTPLPRHFGQVRVAGTIIWATDLVEHRDKHGGGKGKPSVTSYSYSASVAVALASRPIVGIGRIWADGNLLRGAGGDLKVGGTFRLHTGEGDQAPDPLIAAAEGPAHCPAFRGTAYVVFEDLDLGDFGNRIPALTFEVFADDASTLSLQPIVDGFIDGVDASLPLTGVAGLSCEGPLAETLAMLDPVFPMDCDACGERVVIAPERLQVAAIALPEPAVSVADEDFGGAEGHARRRAPAPADPPQILRYYDIDRDYQPGLQRASGPVPTGQPRAIELPAALHASAARSLVETAARRSAWARESISWQCCELDPAVAPGAFVTLPGQAGLWRVSEWEWRASGVELQLQRVPPSLAGTAIPTDPGRGNPPVDAIAPPTALAAFELPWDGTGNGDTPAIFAAASSTSAAWSGAALFVDHGDGGLVSFGSSGRRRSIIGTVITPPVLVSQHLFDRTSAVIVELLGPDMALSDATIRQMAMGVNRALVGDEILQFGSATPTGAGRWRLELLLRGRGGTGYAIAGHLPGERFVLLDEAPVAIDAVAVGSGAMAELLALGLGDTSPVAAPITSRGITLRPLAPVHGRARIQSDGSLELAWTRRARGAFSWNDGVDVPVHEQAEAYLVTYGLPEQPTATWVTPEPRLALPSATLEMLSTTSPGGAFSVRQQGSHALSVPTHLTTLD